MPRLPAESEADYQLKIVQTARLMGWLVYHTHDSRRSEPGFPDLVLVRDSSVVYWEVKTDKGVVRPDQEKWVNALHKAGQEVRIIRPSDWEWVLARLRKTRPV